MTAGQSCATEQILEPELPIVDPHHHLWDRVSRALKNLPEPDHGFTDIIHNVPRYLFDRLMADVTSAVTSARPSTWNAVRCTGPTVRKRCGASVRPSS